MKHTRKIILLLIFYLLFTSLSSAQYPGGNGRGDYVTEFSGQINSMSLPYPGGNGRGDYVSEFSGQMNGLSLPYTGGIGKGDHVSEVSGQLNGKSLPYSGGIGRGDFLAGNSLQLNGLSLSYDGGTGRGDDLAAYSGQMIRINLNLKIFLEGYYTGGGLMNNFGSGGLMYYVIPQISSNPSDVDTVFISAMNANFPYDKIDKQWGILHTDGTVSVNFGSGVSTGSSYYIRAEHRNSIVVWSAAPIFLSSNTTYFFSADQTQAFGNNMKEVGIAFGDSPAWALFSGDINQDGAIDGADFLDIDPRIQNGNGGYDIGDINGDGAVDGADFLVLDPNIQDGIGASIP